MELTTVAVAGVRNPREMPGHMPILVPCDGQSHATTTVVFALIAQSSTFRPSRLPRRALPLLTLAVSASDAAVAY